MKLPTYLTTSWDDGHPSDLRVAELLSRYNLTGTFYIPRRIDSGVMAEDHVRQLSTNFEIGAHTLNHVFLNTADDASARQEIAGSKRWVEQVTGKSCKMFCPPGGKFSPRDIGYARDAGFIGFRTVEFMSLDAPRLKDGFAEMPTTIQAFPHVASTYARNLAKRGALRNFWLYARRGISRDWVAAARSILRHSLDFGGFFHLWGHSWEMKNSLDWARLEEVLHAMGDAARDAPCLTNGQACELILSPASARPPTPCQAETVA